MYLSLRLYYIDTLISMSHVHEKWMTRPKTLVYLFRMDRTVCWLRYTYLMHGRLVGLVHVRQVVYLMFYCTPEFEFWAIPLSFCLKCKTNIRSCYRSALYMTYVVYHHISSPIQRAFVQQIKTLLKYIIRNGKWWFYYHNQNSSLHHIIKCILLRKEIRYYHLLTWIIRLLLACCLDGYVYVSAWMICICYFDVFELVSMIDACVV